MERDALFITGRYERRVELYCASNTKSSSPINFNLKVSDLRLDLLARVFKVSQSQCHDAGVSLFCMTLHSCAKNPFTLEDVTLEDVTQNVEFPNSKGVFNHGNIPRLKYKVCGDCAAPLPGPLVELENSPARQAWPRLSPFK